MIKRMLLGIGYLPRQTGPRLWRAFDHAEIREDLAHIAALGLQAVRVPLFWADFQPGPQRLATPILDRFGKFLDLAHDAGLQVVAGIWTGFWDGALWWPDWGITPSPLPPHWPLLIHESWLTWGRMRSPFLDARMLSGQTYLLRELGGYYAEHPALLGWEPLPGFGRLSAAHPRQAVLPWLEETLARIGEQAPGTSHFLIAFDALENPQGIRLTDIQQAGGEPGLSIATFASDRRRLPLSVPWIAFALRLATGLLGGHPPALFLAGFPTVPPGQRGMAREGVYYASEEEIEEHLSQVVALARAAEVPALWLWRWADIPEDQWHAPPYDRFAWRRHTGLIRADGHEKTWVRALHASEPTPSFPSLNLDPDAYYHHPQRTINALWRAFQTSL